MHSPMSWVWDGSSQSPGWVSAPVPSRAQKCREACSGCKSPHSEKGNGKHFTVRGPWEAPGALLQQQRRLVSPPGCRLVQSSRSHSATRCPSWWHLESVLERTPSTGAAWRAERLPGTLLDVPWTWGDRITHGC